MKEFEKSSVTINAYNYQVLNAAKYLQIIFAEKERANKLSELDFDALCLLYNSLRNSLRELGEDPGKLDAIWQSGEQPKSLIDL